MPGTYRRSGGRDRARPGAGSRLGQVVGLNSASWILFQAHRYDDAIRESRSALAVQPDNASNLLGLGFSLIANDKPADAIPVLEKALTISSRQSCCNWRADPGVRPRGTAQRCAPAARGAETTQEGRLHSCWCLCERLPGSWRQRTGLLLARAGLQRAIEYPAVPQNPSIFRPDPRRPSIR